MRIEKGKKLGFKDVLIRPKRSTLRSRNEVSIERKFTFKHSKKIWEGIPILASNMDTVGTFEMALALSKNKIITVLHKFYTTEEIVAFCRNHPEILPYVSVSSGTSDAEFEKLQKIINLTGIDMICLDVANGYSEYFEEFVKKVRTAFPTNIIIAGNVVTSDMTEQLILAGADIIKVGIGGGSVCTTRKKTGIGYPQLSAVIECADAANGLGAHIISDGGCVVPGDIAKAFGGGAHFVMLGGMLSGHTECAGELIEIKQSCEHYDTGLFKEFYGMSSTTAMEKHYKHKAKYRASEGKRVLVPYKGHVEDTVDEILGGIRSACTYVGASTLKQLSKRTTFIEVSEQANESLANIESEVQAKKRRI